MSFRFSAKTLSGNFLNLLGVATIFLLITACQLQPTANESHSKNQTPAVAPQQANAAISPNESLTSSGESNKSKQIDKGDFIVESSVLKNPRFAEFERKIREEKLLEKAADTLNRSLILPYDIYLRKKDCGEANAHYDSEDHSITVCYELMEYYSRLFRNSESSETEIDKKMFDAVRFVFLHELGHGLIDAYKIPITGSEEDAADRLSSYICLVQMGEDGVRATLAAADAFHIEAKQSAGNQAGKDYSDEHLLQEQRFYNTLCMIYGSDTTKYEYFVSRKYLPEARAARCPNEYERMVQSWNELLQKWRRD